MPAYKALSLKHPTYQQKAPVWETIQDIREGSGTLKAKSLKYFPRKPGETNKEYSHRLETVAFTPVMATAIRELGSKILDAPLHLEGLRDKAFWEEWRGDADSLGTSEATFLAKALASLLYFGQVWVGVDRPQVLARSREEADRQGLRPYAVIFEPLEVPNWAEKWAITCQTQYRSEPFQEPKCYQVFTLWSEGQNSVFECEVKLDSEGKVDQVKSTDGRWLSPDHAQVALKASSTSPGYFLTHAELPLELWAGNNVYLKQLQHSRIESSLSAVAQVAGTIQRVFKPSPPPPLDDPRVAYVDPKKNPPNLGNDHVLIGDGFDFSEAHGYSLKALSEVLESIEAQIRDLVSQGDRSLQQSAKAKKVDEGALNSTLKSYGLVVKDLYENVLRLVALSAGRPDGIRVTGLDVYATSSLEEVLGLTSRIVANGAHLAPEAVQAWMGKLQALMLVGLPHSLQEEYEAQIPDFVPPETSTSTMIQGDSL